MKVGIVSLGCDKNLVDSEYILGFLKESGYEITNNKLEADIIIINTCGFIYDAKQESINSILEMVQYKDYGKCKYVIAAGCLAQRYGDELLREIPELDAVVGTGDFDKISKVIDDIKNGRVCLTKNQSFIDYDVNSRVNASSFTTFLKIAEGCNNRCSYCAIPGIRGKYNSRPMESIIDEAKLLVAKGAKEINIIAQDTTSYGIDIYKKPSLAELLLQLASLEGNFIIRILYAYPSNIDDNLLDVINSNEKIAKYLDIPLQHINNRILRLMNRPTTSKFIKNQIKKIRYKVPNITLRTSLITGFPTETDEEFQELLNFIREYKFDRLGVFKYSREEGTPAADFKPQISEQIKNQRYNKIMETQYWISKKVNRRHKGKRIRVLIEDFDKSKNFYIGRSEMDAPSVDGIVMVKGDCKIGHFYDVIIDKTLTYDLVGNVVK